MIRVEVWQVGEDRYGRAVVLLRDPESQMQIPVWIGEAEAMAIALEMEQRKPPRPLTHDLMRNMLDALTVEVVRVVVNDLHDDTFYAIITLKANGKLLHIDARPSDSIALALRTNAPIYVSEEVAQKAGAFPEPDKKEMERFMRLVGDVDLPE